MYEVYILKFSFFMNISTNSSFQKSISPNIIKNLNFKKLKLKKNRKIKKKKKENELKIKLKPVKNITIDFNQFPHSNGSRIAIDQTESSNNLIRSRYFRF